MEEENEMMKRKDHEDFGEEVGEESYDFRMSYLWDLMKMNG